MSQIPSADEFWGAATKEPAAPGKAAIPSADEFWGGPEKPKEEKQPGLIKRGLSALMTEHPAPPAQDGARRGGTTAELRQGAFGADEPAAEESAAGAGRGFVNPDVVRSDGRRGGTPAALREGAYVAGTVEPPAPTPTAGELLETPRGDFQPSQADLEWQSLSPAKQQEILALKARRGSPGAVASEPGVGETIAANVRDFTTNPLARGAVAGFSQLGQTGVGAVRAVADAVGADGVADFAAGASGKATQIGAGATRDLKGNDKLAADIFSSILNSAPSLAVGMAGGPALRTLFAQSALAEYNPGRDARFSPMESASRAGIMGLAEALGERFGLSQQIALLKSVAKHVPTGELAKTFGSMLAREIPGEQLTTAMQFLADKLGPAALNPNASLADYLNQAGETLKVTIGQTAVMGGGPAAIGTVRDTYSKANRTTAAPEQILAQAIDQAAAQFGLNTKAAATLREKIASMDPDAATNYAEKVFAAAERSGLVKKPGGGSAVRQNAKDLAAKAAKDAEAQQGDASGDSVPAGAAASSDTGLADDMDAGAILGTQAEAPQAASGEAPTEGATDGPMTDEPAQSGVEAGTEPPIEGDLTTGDGQPYGTKASARARATRDGGDVVEVLGGWVVRQSQPSNTRGTNAGDINGSRNDRSGTPDAGSPESRGPADAGAGNGTGDLVPGELPQPGAAGTAGAVVPGADAGNRPAATGPGAGNEALTALQVTFGGKTYPVESVEDAQRKWEAFRDSADGGGAAGVSQIGNGIRVVDGAGRFVARISYNGRVWDTEDDGPSAGSLTAGQPATESQAPAPARGDATGAAAEPAAAGPAAVEGAGVNDLDGLEAALRKERDSTTSEIENGWINGKGRRQQTPIERAVYDAVTASVLDADAAASIVEMALKEGRPDLALYAAKRAARAADSMSTTPGVSEGSPKYEPIKKNLVESKHKAQADAKSLLEKVTKVASPATTVGMASTKTGDTITIDGKPYTVKSAKPKVLVLTGADGKPRTITSDSATWAKVKPAEPNSVSDKPNSGTGPRILGKIGRTPNAAETVELRPNKDGTLTPHQGKYAMVDYETGEPVVIPGDSTNEQAIDAIKKSGAMGAKDKWFGVQKEQPDVVQGRAPVAQAQPDQEGAPAGGVEPAGAAAAPAVPAAGSAPVEADGVSPLATAKVGDTVDVVHRDSNGDLRVAGTVLSVEDAGVWIKESDGRRRINRSDFGNWIKAGTEEKKTDNYATWTAYEGADPAYVTVIGERDGEFEIDDGYTTQWVPKSQVEQAGKAAADPFESEKLNLIRIKEISDRQGMALHTDHMRSDGLAATGWSAEAPAVPAAGSAPVEADGMKPAWGLTREQYFNDPARVRREAVGPTAGGWKASYEYTEPSGAGPFKGSTVVKDKPKTGDIISAPFGRARVTAVSAVKGAAIDNGELLELGKAHHKRVVADALAAGDPVPAEVLADYPDLKRPAATPNAEAPVQAAPAVVPGTTSGAVEADGLKPRKTLQEARTDAALDKQVRENGEVLTRRQWVERKVAEGLKTKVTQEDRIKPMSRMAYFRANNEEQRAHDRKVKEAGKKDVFWIGDYEVTKTEHDYANALTDKAATPNAESPVQAAPRGAEAGAVAPAPSELPRLPVEAYRVERRYANGAVIRPLPGKAFTDGEVQQIADWFRAAKWEVSTAAPSGVSAVNNANMSADDIPEPYTAAQRKKDERRRDADAATAAKTAAQDDYLTGTAAGEYVAATFGDTLNKFNSVALAKFLAGEASTFEGLMNARAADVVQGMGIAVAGRATKDVLADLKARFAGQAAPTPERTPKAQAVKEALAAKKGAQPAPVATHKDPGEPAEPVTPAVVREAIKTGVQDTGRKPSAMRAELLREIDRAIEEAPDYQDFQAVVKTMGLKDATAVFTDAKGTMGEKGAPAGYSRPKRTFKVEGDGVFTIQNSVRQLLTFRAKVESSPGFKDRQAPAGLNERATDALDRRSTDAAIANMVDEGDFQAALDFAEAKGVDIGAVKLTKLLRDRLEKWQKDQASAKAVADYEAARAEGKPAPGSLAAAFAEKDAAADDFALGQEPPKPVDKKVAAKDLAGQKDIFGGATPFADPLTLTERQLNSLRGKPITMKAQTEDGQVASWEIDAAEAVQSLRSREATIQQLVRCLS